MQYKKIGKTKNSKKINDIAFHVLKFTKKKLIDKAYPRNVSDAHVVEISNRRGKNCGLHLFVARNKRNVLDYRVVQILKNGREKEGEDGKNTQHVDLGK